MAGLIKRGKIYYIQWYTAVFMDTGDFSFILIIPVAIVLSLAAGVVVSAFTTARQDVPREMSGANGENFHI